MKRTLLGCALILFLLSFFVWHRRPAGRGTSGPGLPDIKGLVEFDKVNPCPPEGTRDNFYVGVQAQLSGNNEIALSSYTQVLHQIRNEPTTMHNLHEMGVPTVGTPGLVRRILGSFRL